MRESAMTKLDNYLQNKFDKDKSVEHMIKEHWKFADEEVIPKVSSHVKNLLNIIREHKPELIVAVLKKMMDFSKHTMDKDFKFCGNFLSKESRDLPLTELIEYITRIDLVNDAIISIIEKGIIRHSHKNI